MNVTPILTDADLVAYVDGRLSADLTREVAAATKTDAALAARVAELTAGSPDFSGLWDDMLGAVPAGLMPAGLMPEAAVTEVARPDRRVLLAGLGGSLAGLVLGFGGWKLLGNQGSTGQPWEVAVASYHALYGVATVQGLHPSDAERRKELLAVEAASGLVLPPMQLAGLTYRRAQMLEQRGRGIVHIVLTTTEAVPIAFCLTADGGPVRRASYEAVGDMGLVTWADGTVAFCLAARLREARMLEIAESLSA